MKRILLSIAFLIAIQSVSFGADQYKINPYTSKLDNAGPIGLSGLNGNVGINSAAPSCQLDVGGSLCSNGVAVGGSSGWTDDGTNVYLTTSTDNVGIGTTVPKGKLAVAVDVNNMPTTNIYGQIEATSATTPTNRLSLGFNDTTNTGFVQALKNGVGFRDLTLSPLGGNVGVGTVITSVPLHVSSGNSRIASDGSAGATPGYEIRTGGAITSVIYEPNSSNDLRIYSNSADQMTFAGNNVGIGSTAPDVKLTSVVTGSNGATSSGLFESGRASGLGTSVLTIRNANDSGVGAANMEGGLRLESENSTERAFARAAQIGWGLSTTTAAAENGYFSVYTNTTGTLVEKLRVNSNGNVGIGLVAPNALLDISSTAAQDLFMVNDAGTGDTSPFVVKSDGNVGIGTTLATVPLVVGGTGTIVSLGDTTNSSTGVSIAGSRAFMGYDGADAVLQGGASKGVKLTVNNSAFGSGTLALGIDSAGNVGIGTTLITQRLTVGDGSGSEAMIITGGATSGVDQARIGFAQSDSIGLSFGYIPGSSSTTRKIVASGSSSLHTSPLFSIQQNGNVGVGTILPAALLDVSSTAAIDLFRVNDNGLADTSPFLISSDGNVGISTTIPIAALDISSGNYAIVIGADNASTTRTNSTDKIGRFGGFHYTNIEEPVGGVVFAPTVSANNVYYGGGSGSLNAATNIEFFTAADNTTLGGTSRMKINTSGLVGINVGASAPAGWLEMVGNTTTRMLCLSYNAAGGCDLVNVDANGNVGIGNETTPDAKLEIIPGDGTAGLMVGTAIGNGNYLYVGSNNQLGNVGISSTAPGATLDLGTASTFKWPTQKSTTGTRYLCIDAAGTITSSAAACSGT